jgi:peroxiredoxin
VPGYDAAVRSVYILDASGTIRYIWTTENPGTVPDDEELRKALASF